MLVAASRGGWRNNMRRLFLILGDQLSPTHPVFTELDRTHDAALMIEATSEAQVVWSHQARIVLFLSAMRHFAETLRAAHIPLHYLGLEQVGPTTFAERLAEQLQRWQPDTLVVVEPGEWRMLKLLQDVTQQHAVIMQCVADTHFMCGRQAFARWAGNKKELRMEFFYRWMRVQHNVLMQGGKPEGGRWNFDAENRQGFPRTGPGVVPEPPRFTPDATTQAVIALVRERFAEHPGQLDDFFWPVTRAQALQTLCDFIEHRLARFGPTQDAMWTDTPFAWHSLLSTSLNLHLLDPREVIDAALRAYRDRALPLAGVEGFIRQILGWREFIRGIYWLDMPELAQANHFQHRRPLPHWYWTGHTHMACMRAVVGQTLRYGYAHHIQRLMVTGQFALLAELSPQAVADWYLAVYVDAIEWVELPNTAGMALFANGGRFTSKPYIASGQYIKRMSNYCQGCRYRPEQRDGDDACPMTTLYWYFLDKHEQRLARHPRTALMARNIQRLSSQQRDALRRRAHFVLEQVNHL